MLNTIPNKIFWLVVLWLLPLWWCDFRILFFFRDFCGSFSHFFHLLNGFTSLVSWLRAFVWSRLTFDFLASGLFDSLACLLLGFSFLPSANCHFERGSLASYNVM